MIRATSACDNLRDGEKAVSLAQEALHLTQDREGAAWDALGAVWRNWVDMMKPSEPGDAPSRHRRQIVRPK